ncbi:MAG: histidine phosphatase family protein [Actinomycetaceae bacterium]|nr:histidine phosphatase family protein [Actinomycetaceae bacterium]MDY6082678.1 histidine phosphatase family protein [Actinomycetaceae bacterium]
MTQLTTIHLVRHGEVDNPTGVLYGRQPGFHLTPLGHSMAASVAQWMAERDIAAVFSSPLERAQETAMPTAEEFSLPIIADDGLIEAGNSFEGTNVNANRWVLAKPRYWGRYVNPFRPSWGEPYVDILHRFVPVIRRALQEAEGREAMLVSHQLPIWTVRRFVDGKPLAHDPRRRECSLCSVTSLHFAGRQLLSVSYDEPAAELLTQVKDITPGTSAARTNRG